MQNDRQWESDDTVTNCSQCSVKFSVTNRKVSYVTVMYFIACSGFENDQGITDWHIASIADEGFWVKDDDHCQFFALNKSWQS